MDPAGRNLTIGPLRVTFVLHGPLSAERTVFSAKERGAEALRSLPKLGHLS
jgi:hypothetical protein